MLIEINYKRMLYSKGLIKFSPSICGPTHALIEPTAAARRERPFGAAPEIG